MRTLPLLLVLLGPTPALAAELTFNGTVTATCSLTTSDGQLGLSADGTVLGSAEPGGSPAELAITSNGVNTVSIGAPTRTSAPSGYVATGEQVQVAYAGQGALAGVQQSTYIAAGSTFAVGIMGETAVEVHNRIVNSGGFPQGSYQTKTVVTCF